MDKNLRAELSALKSEVLANLKGLEKVVANIDSKLTQIDSGQVSLEEELVDPKALEEARAWVKEWDDAYDSTQKSIRERSADFLNPTREPFKDPLDDKSLAGLISKAREWDEWTYELFNAQWDKKKKQRAEGAINTINMFVADVKTRKGLATVVKDINDANRALEDINHLESAKAEILKQCDMAIIDLNYLLSKRDDPDGFAFYYQVLNDLVEAVIAVQADAGDRNAAAISTLVWLLKSMLETNEKEQFDYVALDPITFEPVRLEGEKLSKYRDVRLREYNRDLMNAFEFKSKRDGSWRRWPGTDMPSMDEVLDKVQVAAKSGDKQLAEAAQAFEMAIIKARQESDAATVNAIEKSNDLIREVEETLKEVGTRPEPEVAVSIPSHRSADDAKRLEIVKDAVHSQYKTGNLGKEAKGSISDIKKARDIVREHEAAYKADLAVEKEKEELMRLSKLVRAGAEALAADKA